MIVQSSFDNHLSRTTIIRNLWRYTKDVGFVRCFGWHCWPSPCFPQVAERQPGLHYSPPQARVGACKQGRPSGGRGRGLPELGGDLVVASHEDGRCLIQFAKTPHVAGFGPNHPHQLADPIPAGPDELHAGAGSRRLALPGFICMRPFPGNRSRRPCVLSANRTEAGGWKTPARAKRWKASSRREFVPETLVVGLACAWRSASDSGGSALTSISSTCCRPMSRRCRD